MPSAATTLIRSRAARPTSGRTWRRSKLRSTATGCGIGRRSSSRRATGSDRRQASGFDAILDDPNFVGGQFSYWNRQGIRLVSTEIGLVQPNSLLPSLRSSKTEGQANFVNPGIFIYNAGVDAEVTQTVKAIFNANYLRFHRTESLEYVLFQPGVRHEIGFDLSLGVVYRPLLINNLTFTFGGNICFLPGKDFGMFIPTATAIARYPSFCTGDDARTRASRSIHCSAR